MSDDKIRELVGNAGMPAAYALLNKKRPPIPRNRLNNPTAETFLKWWVNKHPGVKNKKRTRPVSKKVDVEILPWLLVDTTSKAKRLNLPVKVPNARKTVSWDIKWRTGTTAIPVVNVTSNSNNSRIKTATIGSFCKNQKGTSEANICNSTSLLKYNSNTKKLLRPTVRGPSISELKSKIVGSQKDYDLAIDYIAMKRNGDYGQVKFAKVLHDVPNAMAVKPGMRVVIDAFKNYLNTPSENLTPLSQLIKKLKRQKSKLMFTDAVFWTNDRPAALFAIKVGVPVVIRNKSKYYYVRDNINIDTRYIKNNIVKACMEDTSMTSIAILDSMHDFVRERKDVNILKRIFTNTVRDSTAYLKNYDSPASVKTAESAIMTEIVEKYGEVKPDDDIVGWFNKIPMQKTGIVFDAGKMPDELRSRRIIGAVRISDPATANLGTYNFES
jgi:hypothetical protein